MNIADQIKEAEQKFEQKKDEHYRNLGVAYEDLMAMQNLQEIYRILGETQLEDRSQPDVSIKEEGDKPTKKKGKK